MALNYNQNPQSGSWLRADIISICSVILAAAALGISAYVATQQSASGKVDARIGNCTSAATLYMDMAHTYGTDSKDESGRVTEALDADLEKYAHKALAIARAAQICRNKTGFFQSLDSCISANVNKLQKHSVLETGEDGEVYSNEVC